jgi:signal transduction histidine kinase
VKDNGIGMSPAFQKTMFEPFTQEYRQTPASGKGQHRHRASACRS